MRRVGATHLHVQARMPPGPVPKDWLGRAKKHAHFIAADAGWDGKLWAVGGKANPIRDRRHQVNTFHYILGHVAEGAWVWDFRTDRDNDTTESTPRPESPGTAVPGLSTYTNPQAQRTLPERYPLMTPAATLAELVRRPSVNPMGRTDLPADILYEHRVTDYLHGRLRDLGVAVERQTVRPGRDNLVAVYEPPGTPPFTTVFECHQDTVPVDAMTVEPFAARVEGGKLYGRGACDVKGGAAVMLAAFERLVRDRPVGSARVVLAYTVDEEHTFLGVQELVKRGLAADYAVVAEPTLLNIVSAHKGVVRWVAETAGRACHSSRPENGVNAVYRMARILTAVERYAAELQARPPHPTLGPRTTSVGRITGGVSPNTVPDVCRIDIDRRLLPGETAEAAAADLEAFLKAAADVPFTLVQSHAACPPLDPTRSGELAARLGAAIDAVAGRHEVHAVPYGTDASTLSGGGIPAVVFGPGDIAQAHTKDEWIDLSQLDPAAEILFRFASARS